MGEPNATAIIDASPMSFRQWMAVAIMVLLNALDGFDVLSSAFAGPGIKAEWHLGPDGLGLVLSMELIGMGVGSVLLGGVADRLGRRPAILACLALMVVGMFGAGTATSAPILSAWRVLTGLGIGGMLAAVNALTHELSNAARRSIAMAVMVIGYPLGAFLGGLIVSVLLAHHGWRVVFMFGGTMTLIMVPLFVLLVPEPPAWLERARPRALLGDAHPRGALARLNRSLAALGHVPLAAMPPAPAIAPRPGIAVLFGPRHRRVTLLVAFAYAAHAMAFYFILKMAPAILSDPQFAGLHYTRAEGARALAIANLGGAIGGGTFGWLMHRFGTRRATLGALALSFVMVASFGLGQPTLTAWIVAIAAIACVTNAAIVGFYAVFASLYPPELKATGTGFALTIGRIGAALAPIASGALFARHIPLGLVAVIMACGSLVALFLFVGLPTRRTDGHDPDLTGADL